MTDENLPDRSGTLLSGRYRLVKRLGAGGMGEVYRARNELVNRDVAIKVLKPTYAQSDDVVARVLREARASNAVHHPNVVDVLDVSTDEHGAPIIVQELLDGHDLKTHVEQRGRALTESEALEVMIPVVEAVAAAHLAGIMHRDLKLENIFLHRRPDGVVVPKVLDFGLSRDVGENAVSRLTATGVTMGTPMYMSPEQVQGQRDIDQRTDVWALGVILYELVAGRLPYTGESLGAIFVKICTTDAEPLRAQVPVVTETYERVVGRCLRRDREQRYANAGAVAAELRLARQGATTAISGTPPVLPDVRAQTMDAGSGNFGSAPLGDRGVAPTLASAPHGVAVPLASRPPNTASIGPAVSLVPPASKRRVPLVVGAAAATVLGLGVAWFAFRGHDPPNANAGPPQVTPHAAVPPARVGGTTTYDPPTPAPTPTTPTPTPAGTTHYDTPTPPTPTPSPAVAAPTAAPEEDTARHGRHGRRRTPGRTPREGQNTPATSGTAAAPTHTTPGTTEYDPQ